MTRTPHVPRPNLRLADRPPPPDPICLGPFGISAARWVDVLILLAVVAALGLVAWTVR
mgnify:FL=1